jgi:hypothetical protein
LKRRTSASSDCPNLRWRRVFEVVGSAARSNAEPVRSLQLPELHVRIMSREGCRR